QRLDAADGAVAVAARAYDPRGFLEARAQPLARQFHQAEARDAAQLHARTIDLQRVAQFFLDLALVARAFHVDEVDHHQAAQVADAQLARDLDSGLAIGMERGVLDVAALGGARGVDVDGGERLGRVDHDRAAGWQPHVAVVRAFDLGFDLETREQRDSVVVQLELAQAVRHHLLHELPGVFVQRRLVDQDFADVGAQVIAQRADEQFGFLVDQEGRGLRGGGLGNGLPQLQQVVEVPLQFLGVAANAGGAHDQAHFLGHLHVLQGFLQRLAILAFDAARHAARVRAVRHQHHVAASQRDVRGERGALVAAFFLLDLDDQLLAFLQQFADAGLVVVDAGREVFAGDFLQRKEAVALGAVVDEAGFEGRFDPGDAGLVDVRPLLFARGDFEVEVVQGLAIDDGHTQLLTLSRVDQHAFHCGFLGTSPARCASPEAPSSGAAGRVRVPRLAAVAGSDVRPRLMMNGIVRVPSPRTVMPAVGKHRPERYDGEVPAAPGQEWQAEALSARRTSTGSPVRGQSLLGAGAILSSQRVFSNGDGNFGPGLQFRANRGGRPRTRRPAHRQLPGGAPEGGAEDAYLPPAADRPSAGEWQARQSGHPIGSGRPAAD